MSIDEAGRLVWVRELLEASRPLPDLARDLASVPWDFEGAGLKLEAVHVRNILRRYLEGDLSAEQVETWANLVEGRDDVVCEGAPSGVVEALHELANPLLSRPLTSLSARALLLQLG